MKNLVISLLFLSLYEVNAQVQLQRGDFGLVGEWSFIQSCQTISTPNLAKISSIGLNQTWDALFLSADLQDTLRFKDPTSFPMAHERTNLVWDTDLGNTDTRFFVGQTNLIRQALMPEGNFGIQGLVDYLVYPMSHGQVFKDSIQSEIRGLIQDFGIPSNPLLDSVKVIFQVNHSSIVDGAGLLKWPMSPNGVSCLRRRLEVRGSTRFEVRNKFTGAYGPIPGGFDPGGIQYNHTWVQFFGQNFPSPLLEYKVNQLSQVESVSWLMNHSRNIPNSLEESIQQKLTIWPNPVSDLLHLNGKGTLKIFSAKGDCVLTNSATDEEREIQVSQLNPGMYFLLLENEQGRFTGKFLKE